MKTKKVSVKNKIIIVWLMIATFMSLVAVNVYASDIGQTVDDILIESRDTTLTEEVKQETLEDEVGRVLEGYTSTELIAVRDRLEVKQGTEELDAKETAILKEADKILTKNSIYRYAITSALFGMFIIVAESFLKKGTLKTLIFLTGFGLVVLAFMMVGYTIILDLV